jgi:hypothetical protein
MKTNQAKAVAGIKFNLATRADYERAERDCVKLIILARKAGDDTRAAELSEAKALFQKRARSRSSCAVCGVIIARGATHCRIHSRPKQNKIAAPADWQPEPKTKIADNNNARVAMGFPKGGQLARLGYFTTPVKKIVAKWRDEIGEETLKQYFVIVAKPLFSGVHLLANREKPPRHWQAIYELGATIAALYNDNTSVESWLLKQPAILVGKPTTSWAETIDNIENRRGPRFTANQLALASKRMLLNTPDDVAATFRREFDGLCRGTIQESALVSVMSKHGLK